MNLYTTAGNSSVLLDVIAVAAIIALILAFLIRRHKIKESERKLKEKIAAYQDRENEAEKRERHE